MGLPLQIKRRSQSDDEIGSSKGGPGRRGNPQRGNNWGRVAENGSRLIGREERRTLWAGGRQVSHVSRMKKVESVFKRCWGGGETPQ